MVRPEIVYPCKSIGWRIVNQFRIPFPFPIASPQIALHSITGELKMPENIIPLFLPSRSPELNPVENIWQYLRQTWLSNRVFEGNDHIVEACCDAWSRLIDKPWKIMSIGLRPWAAAG